MCLILVGCISLADIKSPKLLKKYRYNKINAEKDLLYKKA